MARSGLCRIRPQPDHEDSITCEWNDDHEKTIKQNSVSGTRPLVYVGILALVLVIGYGWVRFPLSSPPAPAPTHAPRAAQAAAHKDAEPREVPVSQFINDTKPPAVIPSIGRAVSAVQPAVARAEPPPYTRQLVASL